MSEKVEWEWECAVCGTPMEVAGKCDECALEEFEPKYFMAFAAMMGEMLHAATGQTELNISKKLLDEFDPKNSPKFKWDSTTDNWIMVIAKETPVIVTVNKKFLKSRFG